MKHPRGVYFSPAHSTLWVGDNIDECREAARKLKRLGCEEVPRRGKGSHRIWRNPRTNRLAPLPDWGGNDLKIGTIRAVIRQLGLNWDDFQNV